MTAPTNAVGASRSAAGLDAGAAPAAWLLRQLAKEKRLLALCHLLADGESAVGPLADTVGLAQPALSQHLAMLREAGLVAPRREAQAAFYRLADPKAARLLTLLHALCCPPATAADQGADPC